MGGEFSDKPTRTELRAPKNYDTNVAKIYPNFQVAEVRSGGGTFAPNLGSRYCFATEQEARDYLRQETQDGFVGQAELTKWNTETSGDQLVI